MDILILGVGNLLMGDEGVGVHAIQTLNESQWPAGCELLDGGTGGFHLMGSLIAHETVIFIDATMDGRPAGSVKVIEPKFASDFPKTLSAHDIGLKDMIESLFLLGRQPRTFLVAVSIESMQPMCLELSQPVRRAIPVVQDHVETIVRALNAQSAPGHCDAMSASLVFPRPVALGY